MDIFEGHYSTHYTITEDRQNRETNCPKLVKGEASEVTKIRINFQGKASRGSKLHMSEKNRGGTWKRNKEDDGSSTEE